MKEWMQNALFTICAIPLVLLVCALYWLRRLCGVDLNDDF